MLKWSCDPRTESSLSIAERAHRAPTSIKSEWSFGDAQRPAAAVEASSHLTATCENCPKKGLQFCSVNGDRQSNLQTENVQRHINVRTVAVCVSLEVNGAASSSSELRSKKGLSDGAVATVDDVQAISQLNSVEKSAKGKKDDNGGMAPLFNEGYAKCSSNGLAGDGNYVKDADQLDGRKPFLSRGKDVHDGSDHAAGNKHDLTSYKKCNGGAVSDKEELVSATQTTGVLSEATETVVDELVVDDAQCEDAVSADGRVHSDHRELSAVEMPQNVPESGDRKPVIVDSALLKTDQDQLERSEVSDVGEPGVVSSSITRSREVCHLSSEGSVSPTDASSGDNRTTTNTEDAKSHSDELNPADGDNKLSDIAHGIDNLQSWIDSLSSNLELNAGADAGASIPLVVVQQYASELQKRKSELDWLNSQVKELEKPDENKNVLCDERRHLVSIHARLHNLSATIHRIASETVRISNCGCYAYVR